MKRSLWKELRKIRKLWFCPQYLFNIHDAKRDQTDMSFASMLFIDEGKTGKAVFPIIQCNENIKSSWSRPPASVIYGLAIGTIAKYLYIEREMLCYNHRRGINR